MHICFIFWDTYRRFKSHRDAKQLVKDHITEVVAEITGKVNAVFAEQNLPFFAREFKKETTLQ